MIEFFFLFANLAGNLIFIYLLPDAMLLSFTQYYFLGGMVWGSLIYWYFSKPTCDKFLYRPATVILLVCLVFLVLSKSMDGLFFLYSLSVLLTDIFPRRLACKRRVIGITHLFAVFSPLLAVLDPTFAITVRVLCSCFMLIWLKGGFRPIPLRSGLVYVFLTHLLYFGSIYIFGIIMFSIDLTEQLRKHWMIGFQIFNVMSFRLLDLHIRGVNLIFRFSHILVLFGCLTIITLITRWLIFGEIYNLILLFSVLGFGVLVSVWLIDKFVVVESG